MNPNRILVQYAHPAPHLSRVNRRLADAARLVDGVFVNDLYENYPDFYIDATREQAMVAQAEAIIFMYPMQWYSMPSLMKEWIDVVLEDGWAYGPAGKACNGKTNWLVATTGSHADEYGPGKLHGRPFSDFLAPAEQTAALCGMRWIAPHILHGAHEVDARTVDEHIAQFTARLQQLAGAMPAPLNIDFAAEPHGT